MIDVVVAETCEVVRLGLRALLGGWSIFRLLSDHADAEGLLAGLRAAEPQVVLLDGLIVLRRGPEFIGELLARARPPGPKVLVTVEGGDSEFVLGAVCAGASGSVPKQRSARLIVEGIRQVAAGQLVLPQEVLRMLVERHRRGGLPGYSGEAGSTDALTARETEIVRLVSAGMDNGTIASRLVLSESTVKTHVHRAMRKLSLTSRAQVVAFAYRNGLT
ncbi:LuxR C-terminal-related transcriptional regulator [Amycolatopsis sp. cg13]|uniref:response regulator transcription factor n=1 Tax=Amycolatopsis sp. cg13 TaxID=3238807 RepID=UPI0035265070